MSMPSESTRLSEIGPDLIDRDCPICQAYGGTPAFGGRRPPSISERDTSKFELVECRVCGCAYVTPAPSPESLVSYYPADYYDDKAGRVSATMLRLDFLGSPLLRFTNRQLKVKRSSTQRRALEIGCGPGNNLQPYRRSGWIVDGVEPNPKLAERAKQQGVRILGKFADGDTISEGYYDVIIMNHSLEHTYDPRLTLATSSTVLADDGLIFVELPLYSSPARVIAAEFWGSLEFPVHLTLPSIKNLRTLARDCRLEIVSERKHSLRGEGFRSLTHRLALGGAARFAIAPYLMSIGVGLFYQTVNLLTGQGDAIVILLGHPQPAGTRA
jgi:SAM-dependent methyltransferase